ncbi:MAG: PAAR domain-containing protein [Desulfatitalea sp.]|nr:PAAR domain-containing protein [Desulfatitalea sp.]
MPGQGRIGDKALGIDAHNCNACPHVVSGPATEGGDTVSVESKPAVRKGDSGVHTACCGKNKWTADGSSQTVFINGKQAFRKDDATDHCGGQGTQVEGSQTVDVGNSQASGFIKAAKNHAPFVCDCDQ